MSRKSNGSGDGAPKPKGLGLDEIARRSMQYRIPTIDLEEYEVAPDVIALVSKELCERLVVMPVSRVHTSLVVAVAEPDDRTCSALREVAGVERIEAVLATPDAIRRAIRKHYG